MAQSRSLSRWNEDDRFDEEKKRIIHKAFGTKYIVCRTTQLRIKKNENDTRIKIDGKANEQERNEWVKEKKREMKLNEIGLY